MTIDVGYAHLELPTGGWWTSSTSRATTGSSATCSSGRARSTRRCSSSRRTTARTPRPSSISSCSTRLGIADGLVVVTKADLAPDADRRRRSWPRSGAARADVTRRLAGARGLGADRGGDRCAARRARGARGSGGGPGSAAGGARLAVDRIFTVKGRGTVVTGSLRGGPIATGATLRLLPGGRRCAGPRGAGPRDGGRGRRRWPDRAPPGRRRRVGRRARLRARGGPGGRGDVAGARRDARSRGARPARWRRCPGDGDRLRLHAGTDQVDALVVRGPREAIDLPDGASLAILRLARPIAAAAGDRFALRHPSPGSTAGGGVVLDPSPPRGVSRRRMTVERAGDPRGGRGQRRSRGDRVRPARPPRRARDRRVLVGLARCRGGAPRGRDRASSPRITPPSPRLPDSRCRRCAPRSRSRPGGG